MSVGLRRIIATNTRFMKEAFSIQTGIMNVVKKLSTTSAAELLPQSNGCKREAEEELHNNKRICTSEVKEDRNKIRKRKMAVLLGYCGLNFYGMQRNPGMETIERCFFEALKKANLVTDEVDDTTKNVTSFQRSCRTDKGVSAAKQVVSIKLPETSTPEDINEHLPEQIRVFSIKRVTKGFNSHKSCDARTYSYTLPTYAFIPGKTEELKEDYRITPELIAKINSTLKIFVGTHNFHNFTAKKKPDDPSAKRYMISFEAKKPFVDKIELITLEVKGQSFMLHQIRKMVGFTIAYVKGLVPDDLPDRIFTLDKINIPHAPGLGLVLEQVHYERYNKKFGSDGVHDNLLWDDVKEEVEDFKKKYIYSVIVENELKLKCMYEWLLALNDHDFFEIGEPVVEDESKFMDSESNEKSLDDSQDESALSQNSSQAKKEEKPEEEIEGKKDVAQNS